MWNWRGQVDRRRIKVSSHFDHAVDLVISTTVQYHHAKMKHCFDFVPYTTVIHLTLFSADTMGVMSHHSDRIKIHRVLEC